MADTKREETVLCLINPQDGRDEERGDGGRVNDQEPSFFGRSETKGEPWLFLASIRAVWCVRIASDGPIRSASC
jgi:hypothetical protein